MKLTSITFAAAIAIYMVALASRQGPEPPDTKQLLALDFQDIDALRVESDHGVKIRISASKPEVHYNFVEGAVVNARREGSTLVVEVRNVQYPGPEITIPATVRVIDVGGSEIEALVPPASMSIRSRDAVTWSGDAGSLRIDSSADQHDCHHDYCGSEVIIESGKIEDLTVSLQFGDVSLAGQPAGRTTLLLGPKATFSIVRTRRIGDLSILPYAAPDAPDAAQAPAPEPTKIAP